MSEDTTTPSAPAPNVDPIAAVAELLGGEIETPQSQPAVTDTTDQVDEEIETGDEPVQETETEPSQDDNPAETDEEEDDRTLSQLIGLDDDQVSVNEETGDLLISAKVDGVQSQLSFKEVLAGYQTQKSNTQRSQALAAERKDFEQVTATKIQEVTQHLEYNAALTQQLHNELLREYETTKWDDLRANDPAEYAARQQDQQVRYNQIQQLQQQISQQREQVGAESAKQQQEQRNVFLGKQRELMLDQIPEWRDEGKMQAGMTEVRDFLIDTYGFNNDDIAMVVEARQVGLIRDAMAYRNGTKIAEKKVAKLVPKMQKGKAAKKSSKVTRLDRLTKAAKNAKGADRRRAELDAVAELLS